MPVNIKRSLLLIKSLIDKAQFTSVIDKTFELEEIVEAYQYVETGQKTGNVVITVAHDDV